MITTRLRGLTATAAILAFIVGTPVLMLRLGAIPSLEGFSWRDLLRQDDGTLILQAVTAAAWIAWAWYAITILVEVLAFIRGIKAPRLPGLPQASASRLVGTAALLFLAIPAVTPTLAPARAVAASPAPDPPPTLVSSTPDQPAQVATAVEAELATRPETVAYTVARGDSLWKIAESKLGSGNRYQEIITLNPDVLEGDPDFLAPGTILKLPAPPRAAEESPTYVVQPGDTLAEIAEDELHDASRFPEIVNASRDTVQPDGAHLTNPDLIRPGWTLTIPTPTQPSGPPTDEPRPATPKVEPPRPPSEPASPSVAPTPSPSDLNQPQTDPRESAATGQASEADETETTPTWLLSGLAGAGAVLAAGLFLVLRRHRRIQRRYRLPGHEIAPPPPDLRSVEMTLHREGTGPADLIEHLDRLLRVLPRGEQPRLVAAELGNGRICLHLAEPATLPHPWSGGPTSWTAFADSDTTDNGETAPYPLLASIGQSDDGHLWLLNLEETCTLNLAGDRDRAKALARHLAAELTVTPWSMLVEVHTQGIGAELNRLDPVRLRHHDAGDPFLEQLATDLDPAERLPGFDPDRFRAVILSKDSEPVRRVTQVITADMERSGASVVILDAHPDLGADMIAVTATGELTITHPALRKLRLHAAGLTADEAALCAAIVETTREAKNQPMPVDEVVTDGTEALIDAAGALRIEYVHERPADHEPAGPASLLPAAADTYVTTCATTREDIHQLGPVTDASTRESVLALDPTLDEDIAEWHSATCRFPKLTLLGPVHLRAHGVVPDRRRPYLAELLTYLILHPDGVRTDRYLEATGISRSRLTADISALRAWLGPNPRSGRDHLRDARETRAAKRLGHPAYQADDILVDLDIFRRLRTRAEARGEAGIVDLREALHLVSGEPFTQLREKGWSWLYEGQRHDHIAVSMIADTAHLVVTRALAENDLDQARTAAEIGMKAAPYDDVPHLDYARTLSAAGHTGLAEQHLDEHIHNRDDGYGPVDPPARTKRAAS